jgi:hypothetical protein
MIIRPHGDKQLLITQPDHAELAGHIMARWKADGLPQNSRRSVILKAVFEHDNGWAILDAKPMLGEDGAVLDFMTLPDYAKRDVWPRAIAGVCQEPYAAALVAQHAIHIYRRYRPDPEWAVFFEALETARHAYLGITGTAIETLTRDYFFLRMGDLISLTWCNAWTGEQKDDTGSPYVIRPEGDRIVITPDPFAGESVEMTIAGREHPGGAEVTLRGVVTGSR